MSRIAVLGAQGQVGRALVGALGPEALALDRAEADFSNPTSLPAMLARYDLDAVINAAAYTQVDKAESEPELAQRINSEAPGVLALFCREHGIPLIHYSTDYVFPGTGKRAWRESDAPAPLSVYGKSKLAGEQAVEKAGGDYLIFRTSWVYDSTGKNFFNTMLRLGVERETLGVVADQAGAPTYAPHLAAASLLALEHAARLPEFPSGVYHLCGGGETSWHAFAEAIFAAARTSGLPLKVREVNPIATAEYPTPAVRPLNSRLDCGKAKSILDVHLPLWQDGLKECMEAKIESPRRSA